MTWIPWILLPVILGACMIVVLSGCATPPLDIRPPIARVLP